jgi:hypothetical protein
LVCDPHHRLALGKGRIQGGQSLWLVVAEHLFVRDLMITTASGEEQNKKEISIHIIG